MARGAVRGGSPTVSIGPSVLPSIHPPIHSFNARARTVGKLGCGYICFLFSGVLETNQAQRMESHVDHCPVHPEAVMVNSDCPVLRL